MSEDASACYRVHRPATEADYREAIEALESARRQIFGGYRQAVGCAVCEDSGHTAEQCHHNPLLLARERAAALGTWRCWHCGFEATTQEEAQAHFGKTCDELARCIKLQAEAYLPVLIELAVSGSGQNVHVGRAKDLEAARGILENLDAQYAELTDDAIGKLAEDHPLRYWEGCDIYATLLNGDVYIAGGEGENSLSWEKF